MLFFLKKEIIQGNLIMTEEYRNLWGGGNHLPQLGSDLCNLGSSKVRNTEGRKYSTPINGN